MPTNSAEQQQVQQLIDAASAQERLNLKANAEATLSEVNVKMGQRLLSREDSKACDIAIEFLVRLEDTAKGPNWWFRTKRRFQLVQMYLGS